MQLTITPLAEAGVEVLAPDIVWNGFSGDFALSTDPANGPVGGLEARSPLATAVLMLLHTDMRAGPDELRHEHGGDARGWPGDGFDIDTAKGEAPLGSKLWLYRRHELTDQTAMAVKAEIHRALHPLLKQGAVARIDVTVEAQKAEGRLAATIALYGRDGRAVYATKFDALWRRPGVL